MLYSPSSCLDDDWLGFDSLVALFGQDLLIWLTVCSLCNMFISKFNCFYILGYNLVLIASVPGHCLPFHFAFYIML